MEGLNFLVIDLDGCIDCFMCVLECLVGVIYNVIDLFVVLLYFEDFNVCLVKLFGWKFIIKV